MEKNSEESNIIKKFLFQLLSVTAGSSSQEHFKFNMEAIIVPNMEWRRARR